MYESTIERLAAAGLEMYEISNFARPGHESQTQPGLLGQRCLLRLRRRGRALYRRRPLGQHPRPDRATCAGSKRAKPATGPTRRADGRRRGRETAILMLRRTQTGIERDDFLEQNRLRPRCPGRCDRSRGSRRRGLLEDDGRRVRLSREGLFVADTCLLRVSLNDAPHRDCRVQLTSAREL